MAITILVRVSVSRVKNGDLQGGYVSMRFQHWRKSTFFLALATAAGSLAMTALLQAADAPKGLQLVLRQSQGPALR